MGEVVGRLRLPRLSSPPGSPLLGEVYFDTTLDSVQVKGTTGWKTGGVAGGGAPAGPAPGSGPAPVVLPSLVWTFTNSDLSAIYSSPIVAMVAGVRCAIIPSYDWYVYVLRLSDGAKQWDVAFDGECYGRAQAADVNGDGRTEIFVPSHDGKVHCLDDTGTELWAHQNLYDREGNGTATAATANSITDTTKSWAPNSFMRPPNPDTGANDNAKLTIVSGTGAGQSKSIKTVTATKLTVVSNFSPAPTAGSVYKVEALWESDRIFMHAGTLSQEGGTWFLYITNFANQCVKLNASTGALVWKMSALENIEPHPLVMDVNSDGQLEVLFGSIDGNLYCRKGSDGSAVWTCNLGEAPEGLDAFTTAADVDNDGTIEVVQSGRSNRVHWVNGKTGVEKAHSIDTLHDIDSRPAFFPAVDGQIDVLSAGDSGMAHRFRPDGTTVWRTMVVPTGIEVNSSPLIFDVDGDGEVECIVCDMAGGICFLDEQGRERGRMYPRGGVEGVPMVGDLDGDGRIELLLTTVDGYVQLYRW